MKKLISVALAVLMTLSLCTVTAFAQVTGDGSKDNPFLVSSQQDLIDAINNSSGSHNNIKLMSDITLVNRINIMKPLNIDLNKKTITGNGGLTANYSYAFCVKNGYFKNNTLIIDMCRSFTLENVEFEGTDAYLLDIICSSGRIHNCSIKTTGKAALELAVFGNSATSYNVEITQTNISGSNFAYYVLNQLEDPKYDYPHIYYSLTVNGETIDCKDIEQFESKTNDILGGYDNSWSDKSDTNVKYSVKPTYTVTIPAEVNLGNTAEVKAENVVLEEDKQVVVRLTAASGENNAFTVSNGKTGVLEYNILMNKTALKIGDTVLSANPKDGKTASAQLEFTNPQNIKFAGQYKGNVTYTVSVEDV